MTKILNKGVLAGMGLMMAASVSHATSVNMYANQGGVANGITAVPGKIANEGLNSTGVNHTTLLDIATISAGSPLPAELVITTSVKNPSTIILDFGEKASFSDPNQDSYYLAAWRDVSADDIVDANELFVVVDSSEVAVAGAAVNGRLEFDPGDVDGLHLSDDNAAVGAVQDLSAGTKLLVVTATSANVTAHIADAVSYHATPAAVSGSPIAPTGGINWEITTGAEINAQYVLTAIEAEGTSKESTGSSVVFQGMNEYVLCQETSFNGVIDLNQVPPRTTFTFADPTIKQDRALYQIWDRNIVVPPGCQEPTSYFGQYYLTQAAGGGSVKKVTGTLTSSDQAIKTMNDGTDDINYVGGSWEHGAQTSVALNGVSGFSWIATVEGSTAIDWREFTFNVVSTPDNTHYSKITYEFNKGNGGQWQNPGYTGSTPYIPFGFGGYTAFFKVENEGSTTSGNITVSGICQNLTDGTTETGVGVVGVSEPRSVVTIGQATMVSALGLDATKQYHCAVQVEVDVPNVAVMVGAYQSDPKGRTMLPMYIKSWGSYVQ